MTSKALGHNFALIIPSFLNPVHTYLTWISIIFTTKQYASKVGIGVKRSGKGVDYENITKE